MNNLLDKKCVPCEGGTIPLTRAEAEVLLEMVREWELSDDNKSINKEYKFKDFSEALSFVNKVGEIAESEGHHPDITINYNRVNLSHTTHAIDGLSENDFILAAKVEELINPSTRAN